MADRKTSFGPYWLWREIQRRGPGDYLVVAPTYPLLSKKCLPEFLKLFSRRLCLGAYNSQEKLFTFSPGGQRRTHGAASEEPTKVFFGHAQDPESLESATAKAAWLDECFGPETLVETEVGPLPIGAIVNRRLPLRVWSRDVARGAWELRPITRWIKSPQRAPLVRFGPLRATADHRLWTREYGYLSLAKITSARYGGSNAGAIHVCNVRVLRQDPCWEEPKEVLQPRLRASPARQIAGSAQGDLREDESLLRRLRPPRGAVPGEEGILLRPGQPPVGAEGGRAGPSGGGLQEGPVRPCQARPPVGVGRERPRPQLASGETGEGTRLGERVRGADGQRLATARLQDRRGRTEVEGRHRSRQPGESSQGAVVRGEWLDVSALHQPDGRGVDRGLSGDGCLYNLEVEGNHNYVAAGILVANCGQNKFRLGSWEAIQRRLSIHQGRALMSTTPYNLGWVKTQLWDPWLAAKRDHPDIDVVRFDSTENPAFPKAEFERARAALPRWKFDMFYRARLTRPAGLIYDCWTPAEHVVPRFRIPQDWPRYVGLDFGPVNTAAVFLAGELDAAGRATGRYYLYREYHPGKRTPAEHVGAILQNEPRRPLCVGGSSSEGEWRAEFSRAGLAVAEPPVRALEVGIDIVYAAVKGGRILAFDDCAEFLEEVATYSRELNEAGEVTEKIEDQHEFHLLDALRYICSKLMHGLARGTWKLESL